MKDLVGQTFGQYRIEGSLGTGGMGQVFRGKHVFLDRPAAIKVMHNHLATNPTFRARFLQEAKSTAALRDPHIVEIYEFGEEEGLLYLAMELMTEGTLSTLLQQRANERLISLITGLDLIRQAAEGLAAAHELGMIHRDIKPDNLLLKLLSGPEQGGEQYQLKISDFGLARLAESSGLTAGGPVGTLAYMSPEQCLDKKLDGRSDIYSLGVVLYEIVTGTLPFQINTFNDAMQQHVNARPQPLQQVRPDLPAIVEQIILRCLAKTPEERYQTGNELADALQEAINHAGLQTVAPLAPPPPISPPASQSPRIHVSDLSDQTVQVAEVTRQGVIIGRQNDCDVVLSSEAVSRRHLEVKWDGKQVTVTDLKSSNGTKLGDELLTPQVAQVWDTQEAISIGPFLLQLEMPAPNEVIKNEVIKPAPIPPIDETKRFVPEKEPLSVYQIRMTPLSNPTPVRKRTSPPPRRNFKVFILRWLSPVLNVILALALVLTVVLALSIPRGGSTSPTPTVTPIATSSTIDPNSPEGILAQAKTGTLQLKDPLTTQDNNNWDTTPQNCAFLNGSYQVTASDKTHPFVACEEQAKTFGNFAYEVKMTIIQGDGGGIIFRDDGQHSYFFLVGSDSNCRLGINNGGQISISSNLNPVSMNTGRDSENTLDIVAHNNNIIFYVNNQPVISFSNQVSTIGRVGVLAFTNAGPAIAGYTQAKVWLVP
jgi:serine/threonine protein kinase